MKLKKEFRLTKEEKARIRELDILFIEGEQNYLNGKKLPKKQKEEINKLYFKYLNKLQKGFKNVFEIELEDLKHDSICKHNTNKREWIKCYILSWLAKMPAKLTIEKCFMSLTSHEAYQVLIFNVYE